MGLRGCCTGSYVLGETLEDLLDDPLGRNTASAATAVTATNNSEVRSVSEVRPGLAGVFDMFGKVDKLLDATMDTSALGNVKNGRPVQTMMSQGITAEDLLRADKGTGRLIEWLFAYTARELKMLGFTWDTIVDAGLTVKVVAHKRSLGWPDQDVRSVWSVTWEHIYGKLCQREPVRLAEMQLTPDQWRVFGHGAVGDANGSDMTFVAFLEQVGFAASDLPLFGFKFEQWAQLGMRRPIQQFNFSTEETRTFVDSCYSLDQESALAEYKHFFPEDRDVEQIYNRPAVDQSDSSAATGWQPTIHSARHSTVGAQRTIGGIVEHGDARDGFVGARPVARSVRGTAAARGGALRTHHQHAGHGVVSPRRVGAVLPAARPLFQRGPPRSVGGGHHQPGVRQQQQQRGEVRAQPARRGGGASIGINRQKGRVTLRLP